MLVSVEGGKPENPEKSPGAGRELIKNSAHMGHRAEILNPDQIGGRRALSPLRHPYSFWNPMLR